MSAVLNRQFTEKNERIEQIRDQDNHSKYKV